MRPFVKIIAVAFASGALFLGIDGPRASAQNSFYRPGPPGFQTYGFYSRSFGYVSSSPLIINGAPFRQTYYRNIYGYQALAITPPPLFSAFGPAMYGSSGGFGGPLNDRTQLALQQAQRANRNDLQLQQQQFDAWANERGAKVVPKEQLAKASEAVRIALATVSEADILSGLALNQTLKAIQELEAKGVKANAPFFPPELLSKAVFQGGAAAEVLNFFRDDSLTFPVGLQTTEFEALRNLIERDFEAVVGQVKAGKKIDPFILDRFSANLKKLHAMHPTAEEEKGGCGFLKSLESAVKFLKDPASNGLLVGNWHAIGAGVGELTKHMTKFKLTFGPASAGNDDAYRSLHRGLVAYLTDLAQAKR